MFDTTLICRHLSNELTPDERQKVKEWLINDSKHEIILNDCKKIWELSSMPLKQSTVGFDTNKGWADFKKAMAEENPSLNNDAEKTGLQDLPKHIREFLMEQK
jgi:hypothetical protein